MPYRDDIIDLKAVMGEVAAIMDWQLSEKTDWSSQIALVNGEYKLYACINRSDRLEIKCSTDLHCESLEVRGKSKSKCMSNYLSGSKYSDWNHLITVAPTKTPQQIAKDIKSRLLPEYFTLYKEAYDRYLSSYKSEMELDLAKQKVADIIDANVNKEGRQYDISELLRYKEIRETENYTGSKSELTTSLYVSYGKQTSEIKLTSLPNDILEEILAILAKQTRPCFEVWLEKVRPDYARYLSERGLDVRILNEFDWRSAYKNDLSAYEIQDKLKAIAPPVPKISPEQFAAILAENFNLQEMLDIQDELHDFTKKALRRAYFRKNKNKEK